MPFEHFTAWLMLAALAVYTLFGGADFGAGVWDLLARGPRKARHRELLARAIGPIWEANHVWLIAVVVVLFTCFPGAFAGIMTALHVLVTLVLLGIVARGSSFIFRAYSEGSDRASVRWGLVFSIASLVTPVLLGMTLGTLASGRLRWAEEVYVSGYFTPWMRLFPFSVGVLTLAIFSFLAAVYLCAEAPADEIALREDFRKRALASGVFVGIAAGVTWILAYSGAPLLSHGLSARWWTWQLQLATVLAAVAALGALWKRHYLAARVFAVIQVTLVVLGYGAALFPYLVVPDITVTNSAAPAQTHRLVLVAFVCGAVFLLPALYYLFRVFKGSRPFQLIDRE